MAGHGIDKRHRVLFHERRVVGEADNFQQIDYVCSNYNDCSRVDVVQKKLLSSEHCSVIACIDNNVQIPPTHFDNSATGFRFVSVDEEQTFVSDLYDSLQLKGHCSDIDSINSETLKELSDTLPTAAFDRRHI